MTQANGTAIIHMVRVYQLDNGALPSSLGALVPKYLEQMPTDGWQRPFVHALDNAGTVRMESYGADAQPGGTGEDSDLWWEITPGGELHKGAGTSPR